jgi:hypothetical protein
MNCPPDSKTNPKNSGHRLSVFQQYVTGICVGIQIGSGVLCATPPAAHAATSVGTATDVERPTKPASNRSIPKVDRPRTVLQFPAHPSADDFFKARLFEEPLVPIGGQPSDKENIALAAALIGYSKRSGPDDFLSLTAFLEKYPASPWQAALLTDLGIEYYNTAHYSLTIDAWRRAWKIAQPATETKAKAIADRAVSELAGIYARLGRMEDLGALFASVEGRNFLGPASEKISNARGGLAEMQERPEIAFKCGPYALESIKLSMGSKQMGPTSTLIHKAASTKKGLSLPQVAQLSEKLGMNYQMAFRAKEADFVVRQSSTGK